MRAEKLTTEIFFNLLIRLMFSSLPVVGGDPISINSQLGALSRRPSILIIKLLEYSFLVFEDTTLRAAPCVREILEWDTRRDPPLLVPSCGIVDIVAFKTYPPGEFCHLLSHLKKLINKIRPT